MNLKMNFFYIIQDNLFLVPMTAFALKTNEWVTISNLDINNFIMEQPPVMSRGLNLPFH